MYQRIVVGTDGSETAGEAVRQAAKLARAFGAELVIVHGASVAAPAQSGMSGTVVPADVEGIVAEGEEVLQKAAEAVGTDLKVRTVMHEVDPADAVVNEAEACGADLIVVGNRGMRGARRFLGSVPNNISHHAPCSVLIVQTT